MKTSKERLEIANQINCWYEEYLQARRRIKLHLIGNLYSPRECKEKINGLLKLGGFPNVNQALKFRRECKIKN